MPTLGQAYVQIVPSADGISNSISDVLSGPSDAAGKDSGKKFGSSFGSMMKTGLKSAALGIGAVGVAAGAALGKSISDVSKYGDHVDKMSQKIGMSREGFQKWDYVLQRAGTSIDSMAPVMKTLSNAAVSNSESFQKLGISQEEVANMSQEELFGKTIEALSGMEEGAERTALASKLLGRGASELAPLINGGTDAIKEQMQMAEDYGMVLSDEGVKAAADFVDAQTTLQSTMGGLKNKFAAEFLPAVTDVTNGLAKMFAGDMTGLEDIKKGIGDFVSNIASKVPEMIKMGGDMIVGLINGIITGIPQLAQSAADAINAFADNFGENSEGGSHLVEKAFSLMASLGSAMLKAVSVLIPAVIRAIIAFFTKTDWAGIGSRVVNAIVNAFKSNFPKAVAIVSNAVKQIANKLGFTGLAEKVKSTFESVKQKITEPIDKAKELVSSAIEKIKGFFPLNIGRIADISLPHISVSGGTPPYGILGKGSPPEFSVKWWAEGGIMTKPVLFGGGEAGHEGIIPLDPFWKKMDKIAENARGGTVINVTVNGADNPEQWATRLVRQMELEVRTA